MRRKATIAVLSAPLAFALGTLLAGDDSRPRVVHSSGSFSATMPDRELMSGDYELFPEPERAGRLFDEDLAASAGTAAFEPCFDEAGRRVGDRAVMLFMPPRVTEPTWRIAWFIRSADRSEYFVVESVSLDDARYFESVETGHWKKCHPKSR